MNIIFPANVMGYYKTMIPIVMFDIFSDVPDVNNLYDKGDNDNADLDIRD